MLKENIKKILLPMVNITQWFSISFHFGQKTQELKSESFFVTGPSPERLEGFA